jgi:hypothetical protein
MVDGWYPAPKVRGGDGPFTHDKMDVWGAGTILLFCLTGLQYRPQWWDRPWDTGLRYVARDVVGTTMCAGCNPGPGGGHFDELGDILRRSRGARHARLAYTAYGGVDVQAARLLCCLLHALPTARPMAAEALTHPWLAGGGGGAGGGVPDTEMTAAAEAVHMEE